MKTLLLGRRLLRSGLEYLWVTPPKLVDSRKRMLSNFSPLQRAVFRRSGLCLKEFLKFRILLRKFLVIPTYYL